MNDTPLSTADNSVNARQKIQISVNGKPRECVLHCSVAQLLVSLSLRGGPIAVERNLTIVPSDQFETTLLENGDQLEIVSLTGGG